MIEEPEPETPLEIEDMVPAGWLDMASQASSVFTFTPTEQQPTSGTTLLVAEGDDDAKGGDDAEDADSDDLLSPQLYGDAEGGIAEGEDDDIGIVSPVDETADNC